MKNILESGLKFLVAATVAFFLFSCALAETTGQGPGVGDLVQSGGSGFKVTKVDLASEFKDERGTVSPAKPEHKLVVLEVKFYVNGNPLKDRTKAVENMQRLSMVDQAGRIYPMPLAEGNRVVFRYILYGENPAEALEKEGFTYQVFFSVPKESRGFKLQYCELPPVTLGL